MPCGGSTLRTTVAGTIKNPLITLLSVKS